MLTNGVREKQFSLIRLGKVLAIAWVVLSLAEASVTYICLQDAANIEGNPLARVLLSHNEVLFYGAKLLVTVVVGWGFWWLATRTEHMKLLITCQIFLVAMFAGVLINNLMHL
jgi:hypothetical protein